MQGSQPCSVGLAVRLQCPSPAAPPSITALPLPTSPQPTSRAPLLLQLFLLHQQTNQPTNRTALDCFLPFFLWFSSHPTVIPQTRLGSCRSTYLGTVTFCLQLAYIYRNVPLRPQRLDDSTLESCQVTKLCTASQQLSF